MINAGSAYCELVAFEKKADEQMQNLSLWKLPYRSVYSTALIAADAVISGGRFKLQRKSDFDKGGAMLARYSYWRPYLRSCTNEIGANLANALSVFAADEYREVGHALLYSHFCELMPFVHRKNLEVEIVSGGFRLYYPSESASRYEALDVIASELALTALNGHFKFDPLPLLRMIETWPHVNGADFYAVIQPAYSFHLGNICEDAFMSEQAYERVLGFQHAEFIRVRAAMMSLASWCLGMANAAEARSMQSKGAKRDRFGNECLEWIAPLISRSFVYGFIQQLSKVSEGRVAEILRYFEDDPFSEVGLSGEGYLAPVIAYDDYVLLSPHAMYQMTPERNILYVLNKLERKRFNDFASAELEPSLLIHAEELIKSIPGIKVKTNVNWRNGEIDLLAYCQATNSAIQLQAKAAIPAVGARMTRQLESNSLTAVRQLQAFEQLSPDEKDALIMSVFGVQAYNVAWSSGIISRSSFGSATAWEKFGNRAVMNLPILKIATAKIKEIDHVDLSKFAEFTRDIIEEIYSKVVVGWEDQPIDVFSTNIIAPLLRLNNLSLSQIKENIPQ